MISSIISKTITSPIKTLMNHLKSFNGLRALSRHFVKLDPVLQSAYEMAAPITLTGDFEIEVEFSTTTASDYNMLFSGSNSLPYITVKGGKFRYNFSGENASNIAVSDGKLNKAKLIRIGSTVSLYINGVFDSSSTDSTSLTFVNIGKWFGGTLYFDGIIANAKFTDKSGASDVVTTFKLDNSPAANDYTYSTEILDNNTFTDSANPRQYLIATKGWIITDGGAA